RVARVLLHRLLHPLAELVVGLLAARDAEDGEALRQQPPERERVERGEELLRRQVAGGAEDDEDARVRRRPDLEPFEARVLLALASETTATDASQCGYGAPIPLSGLAGGPSSELWLVSSMAFSAKSEVAAGEARAPRKRWRPVLSPRTVIIFAAVGIGVVAG